MHNDPGPAARRWDQPRRATQAAAPAALDIVVTVESRYSGQAADLRIQAPIDVAVHTVAEQLRRAVEPDLPTVNSTALFIDGRLVDADQPFGSQVLHGSWLVLSPPSSAGCPPVPTEPLARLHVVGGPGAGQIVALRSGRNVLGRAANADVRLVDAGVSRRHASLDITAGTVTAADLGSRNGTTVDASPVNGNTPVPDEAVLRLGDCSLVVRRQPRQPTNLAYYGDGYAGVNRAPRLRTPPPARWIQPPTRPERPPRPRFALLAAAVPLVLGIVMWRLTGQLYFLLCTLLTPALAASTAMSDGWSGRRSYRRALTRYHAAMAETEREVAAAVAADVQDQRSEAPDLASLAVAVESAGEQLWVRRRGDDDVLALRIGTTDRPTRVRVGSAVGAAETAAPNAGVVPVTVRLLDSAVLGIVGETARAQSLARAVLAQVAVLHSPRDLVVVVLSTVDRAASWAWTRWLPHTHPHLLPGARCEALVGVGPTQAAARVAELAHWLGDRHRGSMERPRGPRALVVLDGARELRAGTPGLSELLADGTEAGVHALCLDSDERLLPIECGVVVSFDSPMPTRVTVRPAGAPPVADVVADTATLAWTEQLARRLAPLRDDTAADLGPGSLPRTVAWTDVTQTPLAGGRNDVELLVQRWQRSGACTQVVLGQGSTGPTTVDLARDGPHLLVAGTTGSGKSELLRSLAASLAAANRPDALSLLLIDYKGGAAFGACASLPHTVGLVTDLDSAETERALSSLQAELRRRERLLRSAGVDSLTSYQQRAARAAPAEGAVPAETLGRLVIIVDEFATLNEELSDFVGGLVGVAQRGRALGVHLVLATQRPQGVVRADIRANTNLRICLAVTRAEESLDVLETTDAASIDRTLPGRAYLRAGPELPTAFQAACISLRSAAAPDGPALEVSALPWAELGEPPVDRAEPLPIRSPGESVESDLDRLVRAATGAADRLAIRTVPGPWLPTLPTSVTVAALPAGSGKDDAASPAAGDLPRAPYGLLDLPAQQRQDPLYYDIASGGNTLVVGSAGSGRTTVLRTLAGSLGALVGPADVHLYAVDFGGGLAPLSALPHCGAVIPGDDADRLDRLLSFFTAETARRQRVLAASGQANVPEQRATVQPGDRFPYLLLLVDGWEGLLARYQDVDAGRVVDTVLRLLAAGQAAGLRAIVTADRSGLLGRLSAVMSQRVLLRLADPADYGVVGLRPASIPRALPPGRGWSIETLAPVQTALLTTPATGAAQSAALGQIGATATQRYAGPRSRLPGRIDPLPTSVTAAEITARRGPAASGNRLRLGLGGNDLRVVELDLADIDGRLLIGGPPRSGRSTTLLALAESMLAVGADRLSVIAPRPSPLRSLRDHPGVEQVLEDATRAREFERSLLGHDHPRVVLVDDADALLDSAVGDVLDRFTAAEGRPGDALIVTGGTEALATSYRRWLVAMRRGRAGLLLGAGTALDGELVGARLPGGTARTSRGRPPPGRGMLVIRGQLTPVQVVIPAFRSASTERVRQVSTESTLGIEALERPFDFREKDQYE